MHAYSRPHSGPRADSPPARRHLHSLYPPCALRVTPLLALAAVFAAPVVAADPVPVPQRIATTDTVRVEGARLRLGAGQRDVAPGSDLVGLLAGTPFVLVSRGAVGAGDLSADGFRRHDLTFTVDYERCETACPNRMDTRVGQVDLLEIDSVELVRDGATLQSGLGGGVAMHRSLPGREWLARGRAVALAGHLESVDGSFAIEGRGSRLGARWRSAEAPTDADGRTYAELYGFARTPTTTIRETRAQVRLSVDDRSRGGLRISQEESRDLLFPYLQMDERDNERWEAAGDWRGRRLYWNHTAHVMDNGLRRSLGTTMMRTDAENTMLGLVGDFYEAYGRHWDADNRIVPAANPAAATNSHMLPDVWRWGLSLRREVGGGSRPWLVARMGVARTKAHDPSQAANFVRVHASSELEKWSVPFGLTVRLARTAGKLAWSVAAELAADAPGIEQQFIVVDKPGQSPDWVGNPGLADPLRGTLRFGLARGAARLELFATRANDYPKMVRRTVGSTPCQTYEGVDALLAGAAASIVLDRVSAGISWNWGEQVDNPTPLAEVQPVVIDVELRSPAWHGCTGTAAYRHAAAQRRIDASQGETATGSWNRLDLALALERPGIRYELAIDNATNSLYTQHLSYQRNPFAAGLRVWEPGRTARLSAAFGF